MRTLKGYEAIELAERYDILLYKFTTQSEVTASEARDEVKARENASAYVIEAWPDSEEEAEQLVLKTFDEKLRANRTSAATFEQLTVNDNGDTFMHPAATELAVNRLVEKGTLAPFKEPNGEFVYILSRTLAFTEDFLNRMRNVVCEECADLNFDGSFHESCLLHLFDFLHSYQLSLEDLREVADMTQDARPHNGTQTKSSSGMQWLSKTVSETRSRWKTVLEPLIKNRVTGRAADDRSSETEIADSERQSTMPAETPNPPSQPDNHSATVFEGTSSAGMNMEDAVPSDTTARRPKITKAELIRYLQSIEVLDEGELNALREERDTLVQDLERKEAQIQQLMHQKSRLESQYAELQRDMDVMVHAMRIARQHDSPAPTEVITAYETDQEA